ncbi:MAG: glycogen-binding domain-containing protein [Hyphomicrobiales bacterium]
MNDTLISMYIDNELSLDDKIAFVEEVHSNENFKDDTVSMIQQEKLIRSEVVDHIPVLELKERKTVWHIKLFRPLVAAAAGLAAAATILFIFYPRQEHQLRPYRFVIYQPDARQVELAGSFSGWKRIPMRHDGQSGYWETTLELPEGEHRFSYIIEGGRRLRDPTIAAREIDDLGGENSILRVKS